MMTTVAASVVILFSVLLCLKLFEIVSHAWIVAKGPVSYDSWCFTRTIVYLPSSVRHFVAKYVFRYPVLMIALTTALVLADNLICVAVGACILFLGMWIEITRILIDRLILGPNDSNFRSDLAEQVPLPEIQLRKDIGQQQRLQRFVSITFGLVALVVTSYAALYSAAQGPLRIAHFTNVPNDRTTPLHFLYFSIVTAATVGYGDIQPDTDPKYGDPLVGRLLCGSEVIASFAVLVVLAASITVTFLPLEPRERRRHGR